MGPADPPLTPRSQASWSSFQAILVVCLLRLEERVEVPITNKTGKDLTATAITISGTIFATIYGALLIWLTQGLSLRSLLTSRQTLTAMHDEYNSWIGLGSALMSLYGQVKLRSALVPVILIASYLIEAAILHVTIPAMFSLQVGTKESITDRTVWPAYPNAYHMLHPDEDTSVLLQTLYSDASSLLPYVGVQSGDSGLVGLSRATIYDELVQGMDYVGKMEVSATTFNVTCGSLNDVQVVSDGSQIGDQVLWYNVSHAYADGTEQHNVQVKYIQHDMDPGRNRSFYLYGNIDIQDSWYTLLPNLTLPSRRGLPANMSMIGCDLYSFNHTVHVDAATRIAVEADIPQRRESSTWSAWQAQDLVSPENQNLLDLWSTAVTRQCHTTFSLGGSGIDFLGFMENFMLSQSALNVDLPGRSSINPKRALVNLHDIENGLSMLAASYFWSLNQLNNHGRQVGGIDPRNLPVTVSEDVQRLHLSFTPVVIGFVTSLFLMVTNALLVRPRESRTKGAADVLDSLGLLQITWFVRDRPEVLSTIGRVENPTEDDLRLAGMFVIQPKAPATYGRDGDPMYTLSPSSSSPPTPSFKWLEDNSQLQPVGLHSPASDWEPSKCEPSESSWSSIQVAAERLLNSLNETLGQVRFLRRLSYALHGFLVGLHIALLAICVLHIEEGVVIPLSNGAFDDLTSTAITVSGTVFATIYGALLIWLTQRLALRRLLTSKQTLTAMHDEYNSWIGLGSALMTLYGQSRIPSAVASIACIASYLVNAAILHVTIPAMFTLQVGSFLHVANVTSIAAYPDATALLHTPMAITNNDRAALFRALFSDASSLLPYVVLLDSDKTVGLHTSTMYDQLLVNEGNNTVAVNATTFNVTCGSLSDLKIESTSVSMGDLIDYYNISHVYPNGTQQANVKLNFILPNNTMALGFPGVASDDFSPGSNRSFYLYGTFDIEDSEGALLPNFTLATKFGTPINMSVIGCNLYGHNHTIDVSASTRLPTSVDIPALSTGSTWSAWEPQDPIPPEELNILDLWSTAVVNQFQTTFTLGGLNNNKLGFMEKYIVSSLGLKLPGWSELNAARGRVQLHNVENALSRLAASYFWSLNQVNNEDQYSIQRSTMKDIVVPESVQRLHLNLTPVAIGLAVSLLLMISNALLVRPRESRTVGAVDVLDSLGLLQLIWFVRGRPEVLSTIGRVENPNEDDLRMAGMFVIQPDVRASLCPASGEVGLTLAPMPPEPPTPTYKWLEEDTQLSPLPSPSTEQWPVQKAYEEHSRY
ncbi:hypothetical protein HDZ31DRAFT_79273 [Schizophyllum fasciatum]